MTPGATTATTTNAAAPTLTATVTDSLGAETDWHVFTTSTAKKNPSGVIAPASAILCQWSPDISFQIKLPHEQSVLDSALFWVGMFKVAGSPDSLPMPLTSLCGFRYMRGWGTSGQWTCVSNNDAFGSRDTTVVNTVTADSVYNMRIRLTSGVGVEFWINGVKVATHSTNYPAAADALLYGVRVTNLLGVFAKKIKVSRIYWTTN